MTVTPILSSESTARATAALAAVLPASAGVRAGRSLGDVEVAGKRIAVTWAGEGSLGDVRRALAAARRPDVVVARRLSPGAIEQLTEAGIGWLDETGAAEIALGSIIVSRTGRPPEKIENPPHWTSAALAVAEALLCGARATVAETQGATGLSTGSCTNALRALTDLGLLEASAGRGRGSARRVADRRALLDGYTGAATALRSTLSLQVGVAWRDPAAGLAEAGREWERKQVAWAATGAAAASVLAPHLSAVTTVDAYVDTATIVGLEAAASKVGLRPLEGGRLTLRPFPTVAVERLAEAVGGLRVAPWPRVYVDLLALGVRGEEAAEHLWETVGARRDTA